MWIFIVICFIPCISGQFNITDTEFNAAEPIIATGGLQDSSLLQWELDYMAKYLDVKVRSSGHLQQAPNTKDKTHVLDITLRNNGVIPLRTDGLELYFFNLFMIEPEHLPDPAGYVKPGQDVRIFHQNGMLFRMDFLPTFGVIHPGTSRLISIVSAEWAVSRTDIMPNWYVASGNRSARVLEATTGESLSFVEPFLEPDQWKRYPEDVYNPLTPEERYRSIYSEDIGSQAAVNSIIPTPKSISVIDANGTFIFDKATWVIASPGTIHSEAAYLAEQLGISVVGLQYALKKAIILSTDQNLESKKKGAYKINTIVKAELILVTGYDKAGVFYGIQSLLSLLTAEAPIGEIEIIDEPRYEFRGLHLDVVRNFRSKEEVFRIIDLMSMYKLNVLQMQLGNDEGWRLEIPGLPELTEIGGNRCHDLREIRCLIPQLGSGPDEYNSGSGYYTVHDYREILKHAAKRHVEFIPEIELPAHSHAAIKAMEVRARREFILRRRDVGRFLLSDLQDQSEYLSVQMFTDNVVNPCLESTWRFVTLLVKTLKLLHYKVNPLRMFYFAGEEIPTGVWLNSTACRVAFSGFPEKDLPYVLKSYFLYRLAGILSREQLAPAAKAEAFYIGDRYVPTGLGTVYSFPAFNIWEWPKVKYAYELANAGFKTVMSQATHLYLDHPYEPDPEERGYYWATRYTDTYRVFGFLPENLYELIDTKRSGEPITKMEVCGQSNENCPPLMKPENIMGIKAFSWSETIRTMDQLEYMLFPRLLAVAERAWHKATWEDNEFPVLREELKRKDWVDFANTIGYKELKRLDGLEVQYRIPLPGAAIRDTRQVHMKTAFPGLPLQYSTDSGNTWMAYDRNANLTLPIGQSMLLRASSPNGKRFSRIVQLDG